MMLEFFEDKSFFEDSPFALVAFVVAVPTPSLRAVLDEVKIADVVVVVIAVVLVVLLGLVVGCDEIVADY